MVSESSATLSGHEKEGLALDHMSMNKFEDQEDNHYQCVLYQIVKMAKEANDFSEQTETSKCAYSSVEERSSDLNIAN